MNIFKNKLILTGIAIVVIGGAAYMYLSSESVAPSSDLVVSSSNDSIVGADILSSLIAVNSLNLDTTIFNDINTLQFKDFSQDLPDNVPVGRANPFEPQNFGHATTTQTLPGGPQKFSSSTPPVKASTGPIRPVPSAN